MRLHFFDAHIYALPYYGTGIQFVYLAIEHGNPYYIRVELNQNIDKLHNSAQKKLLMQRAFGVVIDLIQITWQTSGLLPIGKIPYREFVEFRLANQAAIDWKGYDLDLI